MAERAESSAGTKEAHSALTCRLRRRVLLSGFYPQKGESLLPSAVGLGPFWVLVNLLTGLVASYYLFFNYLSYYLYNVSRFSGESGWKVSRNSGN